MLNHEGVYMNWEDTWIRYDDSPGAKIPTTPNEQICHFYGGYAAIQYFRNDRWRSIVTNGLLQINTTGGITIDRVSLWGQRVNKNDASGKGY